MVLALFSACFQSLPPLSTSKLGPSGAYSQVGGFVYVLGPHASLQHPMNSPVRLGVSPGAASTPTGVFNDRFEALFLCTGTLGFVVSLTPQLFLMVYLHTDVGPPAPPAVAPPGVLSALLSDSAPPPCLDECFFFNPLVVGLHTVRFSVRSGCFFVFKLLSFFWLCKEAQCVYLCLHLGWKSSLVF